MNIVTDIENIKTQYNICEILCYLKMRFYILFPFFNLVVHVFINVSSMAFSYISYSLILIHVLSPYSQAVGYRFGPHLNETVPLLINYCKSAYETDEELREYSLQVAKEFGCREIMYFHLTLFVNISGSILKVHIIYIESICMFCEMHLQISFFK